MKNEINLSPKKFLISSTLEEIYIKDSKNILKEEKDYIEDKIEPVYENMRHKFISLYKSEPSFFIRIPYFSVLLGDNVTEIFNDKVITTSEKDLIICGNSLNTNNKEKNLNIELFDQYSERVKYDLDSNITEEYIFEHFNYIIKAYKAGIFNLKPKNIISANLLVNFNVSDFKDKMCLVSCFVASFYISIYLHNGFLKYGRQVLFDLCINELNKLSDFSYFNASVYFQLNLEKNEVGLFYNNNYYKVPINKKYSILFILV